jgi:exopolyphosphatase / guanosine-5'-triphosphate,3'-diphosphate pyrophosphatase
MTVVASIDIGTNSTRVLVARPVDGKLDILDRRNTITRLGQNVGATGRLADEAVERTLACLRDYRAILDGLGVDRLRVAATSASRDEFFDAVEEVVGVRPELLSGEDEGRLSFIGATGDLDPALGPFLIVDIGGGSTEFILGTDHVEGVLSVDVGCVRLTEKFLHDDPPTAEQITEAEEFTRATLAPAFVEVAVADVQTWVAVAGTATTLAAVGMDLRTYDADRIHLSRLGLDDVIATARRLEAMPREERAALGPMHPGRVDVIGGGSLVMRVLAEELAERTDVTELVVSEHDILDGIARALAARW